MAKAKAQVTAKKIEALKAELQVKLVTLGIESAPKLHSQIKANIGLVRFNPESKAEQLAAEVILNKAIFAADIMSHYRPNQEVNLAQEFLHGAHFIIEDNGHLYDILSAKELGGKSNYMVSNRRKPND